MKLQRQNIRLDPETTFFVGAFTRPQFYYPYEFHNEIEVFCVTHGFCRVLSGSEGLILKAGDIIILGSNTPHMTYNLPGDSQGPDWAQSHLLVFDPTRIGTTFMSTPEMRPFHHFQKKIEGGALLVQGNLREMLKKQLSTMIDQEGVARMAGLIQFLHLISESNPKDLHQIHTSSSIPRMHQQDIQRLTRVFEHVQENFSGIIRLGDVSNIADMAPTSFSRFFHLKTGKTFQEYLVNFRINMACAELLQTGKTVTEICYETGFNNLSNFNRQFKKTAGKTPIQFRNGSHESKR